MNPRQEPTLIIRRNLHESYEGSYVIPTEVLQRILHIILQILQKSAIYIFSSAMQDFERVPE